MTEVVEEDELQGILGMKREGHCAVVGCENDEIDERGPVFITADGQEHEVGVCPPHFEAIFSVLGEQTHPRESDPDGQEAEKYRNAVNLLEGWRYDEDDDETTSLQAYIDDMEDDDEPEGYDDGEWAGTINEDGDTVTVTFFRGNSE